MTGGATLAALRFAQLRNLVRFFGWQSKFKTAVILVSCALFWLGLFWFFRFGLTFFRDRVGREFFHDLVGSMLHLFFFMLMVMLLISNGIICYSAFYRSRETGFLLGSRCGPNPCSCTSSSNHSVSARGRSCSWRRP